MYYYAGRPERKAPMTWNAESIFHADMPDGVVMCLAERHTAHKEGVGDAISQFCTM